MAKLDAAMPWQVIGQAQGEELEAIWTYLRTLPRQ
jgi:hypothetical protein